MNSRPAAVVEPVPPPSPRLRRLALAWALLPAALALASAPARADEAQDEVAPLRQQALAQASTPQALLPLNKLYALKGQLEELGPLVGALEAVAASRHALPEVASLARFLAAEVERSRGALPRARDDINRLGFLTRYTAIGGFDNEGKAGCAKAYPPEQAIDLEARYPGKARDAGWRSFDVPAPDGYMDLGSALRPVNEAVAYALTEVDASKDLRAVFHLGASGAAKLFVDGQKVLDDPQYHPATLDQDAVAVTLRKGPHLLLLKLCQDEGSMGFYLRATGPRDEPLSALASRVPDAVPALAKSPLQPEVQPRLIDFFEKRVKGLADSVPGAAQAHAELAQALAFTRSYDLTDRRPQQEAKRAAQLAPKDARFQLLAGKLEDEDANARRAYFEAAAAADPQLAEAQLELARDALQRGHPDQALARMKALAARSDSVEAELLWANALDDLGDFPAAQRRVQAVLGAHPRAVQAVREAAHQAPRLQRRRGELGHLRVLLALRYDDLEARRALVNALIGLGQVDAALEEEGRLLQLDPTDLSALARRAELLAYNGHGQEARQAFDRAIALCPDEADLRERQGRALLALGDRPGAQKAFEAALALRPQNPRLKEALRALRGERAGFGEQLAADARALLMAQKPDPREDAQVLSELTAVKVFDNGLSSRIVQLVARANTDRGVDELRSHAVSYSPDRQEVSVLRARIFHPDGSMVETHGEDEQNLSEPWSGIYYDARLRIVSFPNLQPGDAIELVYRVDDAARDNLLSDYFGDVLSIQGDAPKAKVAYLLEAPKGRPIYASPVSLPLAEARQDPQPDGTILYRWSWKDVPKIVPEPSMPGVGEASAVLHVSTYQDWDAVARFYWGLVRDQLVATGEVKRTAQALGKGLAPGDDLAKARAVYDFVVSKIRYVGLEFGIHGYKPYSVDRILSRGFGDCKDKASLMHALLEQLGVDSDLVLVRMKHLGAVDPKPASLAIFNHAILYVPKLDLYLDGTAEYFGSAELPAEDRGAMALVVRPGAASQIGTIPLGKPEQNVTSSTYEVALGRDGAAEVSARSAVAGLAAPEYRRAYATSATRRAVFEQAWSRTFPGLSVERVDVGDVFQLEQPVSLQFALKVPHYGDAGPGGLIFSPFGKARSYVESYAPLSQRRFDVVLAYPWQNRFTYRYRLPAGLAVRSLPSDVNESTPFGSVRVHYRSEGRALTCEGELTMAADRVAAAGYPRFRAFLADVDQALGRKVELVPAIKGVLGERGPEASATPAAAR